MKLKDIYRERGHLTFTRNRNGTWRVFYGSLFVGYFCSFESPDGDFVFSNNRECGIYAKTMIIISEMMEILGGER